MDVDGMGGGGMRRLATRLLAIPFVAGPAAVLGAAVGGAEVGPWTCGACAVCAAIWLLVAIYDASEGRR